MINILIVEDSKTEMLAYQDALKGLDGGTFYYACSGEEVLLLCTEKEMDIFFLDVELPDMDGFQLAKTLRTMDCYELTMIVFATGHTKNQIRAFKEFHCYDYLEKPFSLEAFREKIAELILMVERTKGVKKEEPKKEKVEMIWFSNGKNKLFLSLESIVFVEVEERGCKLHLDTEILYLKETRLKEVLGEVNQKFFIQCHKSFGINVRKIATLTQRDYRTWEAHMKSGGVKVDISKKYYDEVAYLLETLWDESEDER